MEGVWCVYGVCMHCVCIGYGFCMAFVGISRQCMLTGRYRHLISFIHQANPFPFIFQSNSAPLSLFVPSFLSPLHFPFPPFPPFPSFSPPPLSPPLFLAFSPFLPLSPPLPHFFPSPPRSPCPPLSLRFSSRKKMEMLQFS
ncbi:unnamed protein product [Closterium sp. NIES-64]|nr:unnamed protein product [Closterium sp. NIES-64]